MKAIRWEWALEAVDPRHLLRGIDLLDIGQGGDRPRHDIDRAQPFPNHDLVVLAEFVAGRTEKPISWSP